jgi:ferritin
LTQERHVSEQIRRIYAKAQEVEDFETLAFLKWFLDEQVEEEKTAQDFLGYVELANGDPVALLGLDEKATPSPAPTSLP